MGESGLTGLNAQGTTTAFVTKYDASGNQLWRKSQLGVFLGGVAVDHLGNVVTVGSIFDQMNNSWDLDITKYDSSGNELWTRTYRYGCEPGFVCGVAIDSLDNIVAVGGCQYQGGTPNWLTAKYDSSGNELWLRTYDAGATSTDVAEAVAVDSQDNVVVTGLLSDSQLGANPVREHLEKYDSSGNELWNLTPAPGLDAEIVGKAVAVDSNDNIIVANECPQGGESNYSLSEYDAQGTLVWNRQCSSQQYEGVAIDSLGNVVAAGSSYTNGNSDIVTTKYGVPLPNTPVGSPVTVTLNGVAVTFSNVTVAGNTTVTQESAPCGSLPSPYTLRGAIYHITTTATYSGNVIVTLPYPSVPTPNDLRLFHCVGTGWNDITTGVDTALHVIHGQDTTLSWWAIGDPPEPGGAHSAPVFPSIYIGIGAALGAGIVAYFVRRRLIAQKQG